MTASRDAKEVFLTAAEISAAADRQAYLDSACAGDAALRRQVEELLEHQAALGSFLESPRAGPMATLDEPLRAGPGTAIGSYKLLQQIGEGGMGVVYMAEQTEPIARRVALKIIKPGMDTRQIIRRFEAERQALAMMDHVNIARVFDGGATENGRPYFVMELVHGVPITKYCDDNHLTPRERLELFVPVCQAIQHAHQKGIIHRDIKPSNVMVTLYDGKPVSKVIDFGVAKATEQKLTERTLFTQYGTMVGTLEYMSPEQAEMSALGVDTRSDIYALGVLLYELLTGSTPLTHARMKEAAYAEILRMIKEEEPPKPSTRLSDSGEALASISANRHTEPAKLAKLMRGELDWIVMKCLEKDRNRRYETANGFAMDVQRYLTDEPVLACPPSAWYRFRKFARRHKPQIAAAALLLFALLAGIGFVVWHNHQLDEKNRELLAANAAEKQAKETAEQREAETKVVLDFVEDRIFSAARPEGESGGLGHDVTLRLAVESAVAFVETSFRTQPLIEARLRMSLGMSFFYLGEAAKAAEQFQRSRTLYTEYAGVTHPDTLTSMNNLANSYADLGRLAEALKLREETLGQRQSKLGSYHPATLGSMNELANSYADVGRLAEAFKLREETLALQKANLGPDHIDTLTGMSNLATSYADLGRLAEALKLREETLALRKAKLGSRHPDTLMSMNDLAASYYALGRHAEALKLFEETLGLQKANLGLDHPFTLMSMNNLAASYHALGRHDEALKLLQKTLALRKAKLGPDHPDTLTNMNNLALSYAALGLLGEALKLREETLLLINAKLGSDHPATLLSMKNLASSYADLGRLGDALKLREETLALCKTKLGTDHPETLSSMNNLANTYADLGRHADALKLREETLALRKANLGPDHPDTLQSMMNVAGSYCALDRHVEAVTLFEETVALQKAKLDADHPDTLLTMHNLANTYADLDRHAEALKLGEETLALMKANLGPDHPDTLASMHNLAVSYADLGRLAEALKLREETLALRKSKLGADHPDTLASMNNLANTYADLGRHAEAHKLREETLALRKSKLGADHPDTLSSMNNLANTYADLGRHAEALKLREETLALMKANLGPDHSDTLRSMNNLAVSYADLGRLADALKLREETLALMKAKRGPDDPDTFTSMQNLASTYADLGRHADALKLREETLALQKGKLGSDHADTLASMNILAWLLATSPDPKLRDASRAVELGQKAVESAPKDGNYWNTLGVARYRSGEWQAAIDNLLKSRELLNNGLDSFNSFFLAMAFWQIGEKEQARNWYDQAVEWMDKNQPNDDELLRFRAEAEELLGLKTE